MTADKAIRLAIASIKKERQQIAFDANYVRTMGEGSPSQVTRAKHYADLGEAIQALEMIKEELCSRKPG